MLSFADFAALLQVPFEDIESISKKERGLVDRMFSRFFCLCGASTKPGECFMLEVKNSKDGTMKLINGLVDAEGFIKLVLENKRMDDVATKEQPAEAKAQ
jgi:hypothetical protein